MTDSLPTAEEAAQSDGTSLPTNDAETWPSVVPLDPADVQPSAQPTYIVARRPGGVHMEASYKAQTTGGKRFFRVGYYFAVVLILGGIIACVWLANHGRSGQAMMVFAGMFIVVVVDFLLMIFVGPKMDAKYRRAHPVHDREDEGDGHA